MSVKAVSGCWPIHASKKSTGGQLIGAQSIGTPSVTLVAGAESGAPVPGNNREVDPDPQHRPRAAQAWTQARISHVPVNSLEKSSTPALSKARLPAVAIEGERGGRLSWTKPAQLSICQFKSRQLSFSLIFFFSSLLACLYN